MLFTLHLACTASRVTSYVIISIYSEWFTHTLPLCFTFQAQGQLSGPILPKQCPPYLSFLSYLPILYIHSIPCRVSLHNIQAKFHLFKQSGYQLDRRRDGKIIKNWMSHIRNPQLKLELQGIAL